MTKKIIGVMGPGSKPTEQDLKSAFELGKLIAKQGWVLLTGGRKVGVMDAASRGAREEGGLTVGVLPGRDRKQMSNFVDIPIITGMGSARNNINVLSADVVVACGTGAGTISEVMLGVKADKNVIVLNQSEEALAFYKSLATDRIHTVFSPSEVIQAIQKLI